jgi:hypothetical protein
MRELQLVRELLTIAILSALLGTIGSASLAPESFGRWLQKIDTGRFEYLDCDCTEPLE